VPSREAGPALTPGREPATNRRRLRLAYLGDANSRHTRRWLDFFVERGHDVHLFIPAKDVVKVALDPRLSVHRFNAWPRVPIRGVGSVVTALSLRRELASVRPDLLHAHYLTRYGVAGWLSRFHPFVLTVWGSDILVSLDESRLRRWRAHLVLRAADLVTGGSTHLIRKAIAAGARPERTRFIHFGVDTARFAPGPFPAALAARLGTEGRRVVLSTRTIAPLYRQSVVLNAMTRLPSDVVVILTRHAAVPDEVARIDGLARELGIEDRVRIVDEFADADMPDLYRLADVVVSVPRTDGGPVSIVEALAVGRPIVATDVPAVREWLEDLDPAGLVPVDDVDATAAALARALSRDRRSEEELGRRGRAAIVERADRTRSMEAMERLYLELASGSAPSGPEPLPRDGG
jgi:glycosyltransferase involved in cell wall biosynthesis